MQRTIVSHDTDNATAVVQFDHNGVVVEYAVDLKMVVPGSMHTLEQMGIAFTQELQLKTLDIYTGHVERHIDEGIITNPPKPEVAVYTPPEPKPDSGRKAKKQGEIPS